MNYGYEAFDRQSEPTEKRQRSLTQKDVDRIRVGDRYDYRGRKTITFAALYDAEVISVSPHTITLSICIDQASASIERYGAARAYNWTIQKRDIGTNERLYEQRKWSK